MKKISLFTFILLINLIVIFSWTFFTQSVTAAIDAKSRKKIFYYLYNRYIQDTTDNDVREDDPVILSYQGLYDVQHYDLRISFNVQEKKIFGDLTLNARNNSDTLNLIYINFYSSMKVNYVKSYDSNLSFRQMNNYLIIDTKSRFRKSDIINIEINYEGTPKNMGFDSFSFKTFDNYPAIYSLSEPNYAPTWWPCKDVLNDKFNIDLYIRAPKGLTAGSNGLLTEVIDEPDGEKTFHWKSSYPISTYLVSIAVAKYDKWVEYYKSQDSTKLMPVEYYTFPTYTEKAKTDWKYTVHMIDVFSKIFGEYPFLNEKYGMAMFGWVSGAMEHQTLTSMGYTLVTGSGVYESIISHELAHQWFGDAITPETWKDVWLNEGFATYGEALWVEKNAGFNSYIDYMKSLDYGYFKGTVYGKDAYAFGSNIYNKGAWVLHMLRGVVGDSTFFKILRTYYDRFKYKTANTQQLKSLCEEISGYDLTYFFDEWIFRGTGRPEYEFSWKTENFQGQSDINTYTLILRLKQKQDDYQLYKMPVKVTIQSESGIEDIVLTNDKRDQYFRLPVKGKVLNVQLDKDSWVMKSIKNKK